MEFTDYQYLTELEKKEIQIIFKGWKLNYLRNLKFKRTEDGWMVRDEDLKATQYMHVR